MIEKTLTIYHKNGLHARPAALFVKTANRYKADLKITNLTRNIGPVNAKSVLHLMQLAATQNSEIQLTADGEDAQEAIAALTELVKTNFGEQDDA